MTKDLRVALEAPDKATLDDLGKGLSAYNERFTGRWEQVEFVVSARDGEDKLLGGFYCVIYGPTLFVKWVWLDENVRKTGLGAKLLADAEREGRRRGATLSHLDTFSFQARGFYEKYGYSVFGTLDYPGSDIQRHYMAKLL